MTTEKERQLNDEERNVTEAVMVVPPEAPIAATPATPQQMRVMEVNEALAPAYAKASTLEMTEAEIEALMAPFPDAVVEVRPHDGLIYIPHIHISDRLNRVFKPGKWSMVCRRHWLEGQTMYGEYIMLIRGCYVGESVGGHPYQPNNPKVNYSDTLESTAAEALRRIAGKRLSCGWQVWDPTYANDWCQKYRFQANGKYYKKMDPTKPSSKPATATTPAAPAARAESRLEKFIKEATSVASTEQVTQFLIDLSWLMPNENILEMADRYLPKTAGDMKSFKSCLENWLANGATVQPYDCPIPDPAEEPEEGGEASEQSWYNVIVPIPRKGMKRDEYMQHPDSIGSLYEARKDDEDARKRLWGLCKGGEECGWVPKPREYNGKVYQPSDADKKFYSALKEFAAWHKDKE